MFSAGQFFLLVIAVAIAFGAGIAIRSRSAPREAVNKRAQRPRAMAVDLSTSEFGFIRIDAAGRITDWNDAAEKMFGYRADEVIGQDTFALLVPDDQIAEERELIRAARCGETPTRDTVRRRRDGTLLHVAVSTGPLIGAMPDEVGQVLRDISHRRRMEQELAAINTLQQQLIAERTAELEASQRYLRGILDAVPLTIAYWDRDLRNRFANNAYATGLGLTPEAMCGRTLRETSNDLIYNNAKPYVDAALRGVSQYVERNYKTLDGKYDRYVLVHYLPDTVDGEVTGFYIVGHDITELTESRLHLLAQRQRLDYILRGTNAGTWEWNLVTGEIRANERWAETLGYQLADIEPLTLERWRDQVHKDDEPGARARLHAHLNGEVDYFETEYRMRHRDGRWIWVSIRGSISTRLPDGRAEWVCGTQIDITVRREAEDALRRTMLGAEAANAAKSAFLANMSHEIRTPLNAVLGMAYLLDKTALDDEQRGYLQRLEAAGAGLLGLINDVLDLSKIEAGQMLLDLAAFDPAAMLAELGNGLRGEAQAKGLALRVEVAPGVPPRVFGDLVRIRQVLLNLIGNAIKFTECGEVRVALMAERVDATHSLVTFSVRDTGIGIRPDEVSRLFSPFVQADASTTRRFGGTGLGLSIVKLLVNLMGGEVSVDSAPGVGSEFRVRLPLSTSEQIAGSAEAQDRAPDNRRERLQGLRVLVVDDNPVNLELMCGVVARSGAVVSTCTDGSQAVDLLRARGADIDIVLMDVHMPVMDGCEATRRIRGELRLTDLPILAVTAGALVGERQNALEAGMNDFLTKPLPPARLIEILQAYAQKIRPGAAG